MVHNNNIHMVNLTNNNKHQRQPHNHNSNNRKHNNDNNDNEGVMRLINPPFPRGPRGGQRVIFFVTPLTIYILNFPDLASPGG